MKARRTRATFTTRDGRSVSIRPIKKSDVDSAVRFVNALVRERRSDPGLGIVLDRRVTRRSEAAYIDRLVKEVRAGEAVSVAAEAGGEIVANSEIRRRAFSSDLSHTGTLGIAVLEGYRGVGVGRRVLGELLRRARAAGIILVELEVFASNGGARRLYGELGFKDAGRVPGKVRRGPRRFTLVRMYRDLGRKQNIRRRPLASRS